MRTVAYGGFSIPARSNTALSESLLETGCVHLAKPLIKSPLRATQRVARVQALWTKLACFGSAPALSAQDQECIIDRLVVEQVCLLFCRVD